MSDAHYNDPFIKKSLDGIYCLIRHRMCNDSNLIGKNFNHFNQLKIKFSYLKYSVV